MKLYEAFLQKPDSITKTLTAISPQNGSHQQVILKNIIVLKFGYGIDLPVRYDTPALILNTEGNNILLGYYDPSDKYEHKVKTIADGDMFLTCGETRALRTSDDGSIEIVNMFRKEDGEIVFVPIVSYNKDNELRVSFEKLILDMYGASAGGNIVWTQDKTLGFNSYVSNYKTHNQDTGPRIYSVIEGTPSGPAIKYVWDITPTPIGAVLPSMDEHALPLGMVLRISPSSPLDIVLMAMSAPIFNFKVSNSGDLLIEHGISKAKISMSAAGEISIQSAAGTGKITMSPIGEITIDATTKVNINAKTGADINVMGNSLMGVLKSLANAYSTHTHATGTGPSSPPVVPIIDIITGLNIIKGV